jgi:hypothetical protein
MIAFERVLSRVERPACAALVLVIVALGYRSTVSCLDLLFSGGVGSDSFSESSRIEPRDRLPKPTRQQFSPSMQCLRDSRTRQAQKPPWEPESPLGSPGVCAQTFPRRSAMERVLDRATQPRYLRPHETVLQSPLSPPV